MQPDIGNDEVQKPARPSEGNIILVANAVSHALPVTSQQQQLPTARQITNDSSFNSFDVVSNRSNCKQSFYSIETTPIGFASYLPPPYAIVSEVAPVDQSDVVINIPRVREIPDYIHSRPSHVAPRRTSSLSEEAMRLV